MNSKLMKQVLDKIEEVYPNAKKEAIVLLGSRALGLEVIGSDIDVGIFSDDVDYYREISTKKGLRTKGEDPGFEFDLDEKILLEVKIHSYKINHLDIFWANDLMNAKPLVINKKFSDYKKRYLKQFYDNYDKILMKSYIHFFNEFKQMQGMVFREGKISGVPLEMKKGIVLQALFRLVMIMDKKPYICDKWLYHFMLKTKYGKAIDGLVRELDKIKTYEDWIICRSKIRDFIDSKMPNKPYVGNWWKYLKDFKEMK